MGWLRFRIRLFWHEFKEKVRWKVAWALPRSIALLAFVRVSSASGEAPGPEYVRSYKAFEEGQGK